MHALNECSFTEGNIRMKNKEKAPFSRGAYYVVRNPQNYPTVTFFGGDPAQGAFDAVIRPTLSYSLNGVIWMQNAKAPLFR